MARPVILGPNGRPLRSRRAVRAKYDSAQTTADNMKHWGNADSLSADAANSATVRQKLRDRARYEIANSGYLHGIVQTLAADCVGIGPTVQVMTEDNDTDANTRVEVEFRRWMRAIRFARKLRVMRKARCCDGESFALMTTSSRLGTPVTLDLKLIEADQISTPSILALPANAVDGIVFDKNGEPVEYHLLKHHPGEATVKGFLEYDRVPADRMIHWFRQDRPGQHRGIPEIASTLSLWSQVRRFSEAVLAACETAADFAAVLESTLPPDETDETPDATNLEGETWDTIELEKRMATVLPHGYKLGQVRAEQPTTGYAEYMRGKVNEGARPVSMPYNVAACDSSSYNYASGRLDHQTYDLAIGVDRDEAAAEIVEPLFAAWLAEAVLLPEYLPPSVVAKARLGIPLEVRCYWRGRRHVDPMKEAMAARVLSEAGLLTKADYHAASGDDWEAQEHQRYREIALARELERKLPAPVPQPQETPA